MYYNSNMPRANRNFVPGYACPLTHRCHNRECVAVGSERFVRSHPDSHSAKTHCIRGLCVRAAGWAACETAGWATCATGRRLPDAHVGSADRLVCYVADCRVGTPGRFELYPFGIRISFGFRDSDFGYGCGCAGPLPGDHHQKAGVPVVRTRMASKRCHSVWPSRKRRLPPTGIFWGPRWAAWWPRQPPSMPV
jgi:hypothetical protein